MRTLPLLVLLALGACAPHPNMTLNPVQQPVVERTDYVIDLGAGPVGLPTSERARLVAWLDALHPGYGDNLAVDDPERRLGVRDAVASVAGERGLLLASAAPVIPGEIPPGAARVVLSRSTVSVPGCPDFAHEQTPHQAPETSRNYGCSTNTNLAAMIADPQDLLRGRAAPLGDPTTTVRAVKMWREVEPSGKASLTKAIAQEAAAGGK